MTRGTSACGGARVSRRTLASVALLSLLLAVVLAQRVLIGSAPAHASSAPVDRGSSAGLPAAAVDPAAENPELPIITPPDGNENGRFGSSVALSGDGSTALVGAPKENGGAGAAWVFARSGGQWNQTGSELTMPAEDSRPGDCGKEEAAEEEEEELEGGGGEGADACRFGLAVALTRDGDTALVGAPHASNNDGAVWIFTRAGSTWTRVAKLSNPAPESATRFGSSVAVSADGATVLVGAPMWRGRAWVFTRSGSTWSPQPAPLTGGGGEGEGSFGRSVALSADGQTALVGAPGSPTGEGAAWLFTRSGSSWSEPGVQLKGAGESPGGRFGASVALSGDGATALVGARNDANTGAAWAFADSGEGWSEQGKLTGPAVAEERFGSSVALSFGGDLALIGAPHSEGGHGAAWLFTRSGASWGAAPLQLQAGISRHALFGTGVALSDDAETRLVGGRADNKVGAAWVFGKNPAVEAVTPDKGPSTGATTVTIAGEHLTGAVAVRFGANAAESFTVTSGKSITAVSPPGSGTVDVTVETPIGLSAQTPFDSFNYTGSKEPPPGGSGGEETGNSGGGQPAGDSGPGSAVVLTFGPASGGSCDLSLLSRRIFVQGHHHAMLKLRRRGSGRCRGRLSLRVRVRRWRAGGAHATGKAKRRYRTRSVGGASFSIASGSTTLVKVKLNAAGRRLLKAHHGRLAARLLIVKVAPAPARRRSPHVRLVQRHPRRSKSGTKTAEAGQAAGLRAASIRL